MITYSKEKVYKVIFYCIIIDLLLKDLKAINILTWKKKYINQGILYGTQWNVTIDVDGRKKRKDSMQYVLYIMGVILYNYFTTLKKIELFEDIINIIKKNKYIRGYRGGNYD